MHPAVAWDTGGLRISNRPPLRTVLDGPGRLFVPSVFIYPDSASASTHPASTTQLVITTGQCVGAVGGHLRILFDAGLLTRPRSGRTVLYQRTPAGDSLVAATEQA